MFDNEPYIINFVHKIGTNPSTFQIKNQICMICENQSDLVLVFKDPSHTRNPFSKFNMDLVKGSLVLRKLSLEELSINLRIVLLKYIDSTNDASIIQD